MTPHILIVDDDDDIRNLLKRFLTNNNYTVSTAPSISFARNLLNEFQFDLIIMDILMPNESGLDYLSSSQASTPVILLSALSDVDDKINGLKSGAEDYLSKPFDPRELLLRIEKIIKRTPKISSGAVYFGSYEYKFPEERLYKNHKEVNLTQTELSLLQMLSKQLGKAISREVLASSTDDKNLRAIDTQIARLRTKLEENPKNPKHLLTVRGIGYMLKA